MPGIKVLSKGDDVIQREFLNWMGWKVLLPLILIILIWPLYGKLLHLPHPFVRAFAHGDLLIFSSLVLMEASIVGEHIPQQSFWSLFNRIAAKIAAIVIIAIYAAIKYSVVLSEDELLKTIVHNHLDSTATDALSATTLNS